MIQVTKIVKSGTSLGVIIPKNVLAAFGWVRGDKIYFGYATGETLTITKLDEANMKRLFPDRVINAGEGIINKE